MIDPSSTDAAIHSFVPLATACLPDLYTLNYLVLRHLSLPLAPRPTRRTAEIPPEPTERAALHHHHDHSHPTYLY